MTSRPAAGLHSLLALQAGAEHVTAVERWLYLSLAANKVPCSYLDLGVWGSELGPPDASCSAPRPPPMMRRPCLPQATCITAVRFPRFWSSSQSVLVANGNASAARSMCKSVHRVQQS